MSELRECPFCGGEAEIVSTDVFWVKCKECGAESPEDKTSESKSGAADGWNDRVDSALTEANRLLNLECEELKGDVEKLKQALQSCVSEVESYICNVSYCDVETAYREALIPMEIVEAKLLLDK